MPLHDDGGQLGPARLHQHGAKKNNGLANSITCINSGYNKRCFNDGYHIGHHLKANRHWTEMPQDFIANKDKYAREGGHRLRRARLLPRLAFCCGRGSGKTLAKRFVRLGEPMTDDEVILLLKERVKPVRVWTAEKIGVQEPA